MDSKIWFKIHSVHLTSGSDWLEAASSVRAKVFGAMLKLAQGTIRDYHSDMYHDAMWLREWLNGPMAFDWIARESGTFIGDTVVRINEDDWEGLVKYRLAVRQEDLKWILDIYQSVPVSHPLSNADDCDVNPVNSAIDKLMAG